MVENITQYLEHISVMTYIAVFLGGVAMSFTPCVYPLIPIVAGVIGSSRETSKMRSFLLSLSYVMGVAITFSILGTVAALTGRLFGQIQSNPIANLIVGNLMIFFGLAMADIIPLPTFLLARAGAGKVVKGRGAWSTFIMGLVSGLVAAPCTAAILGALLTYVATTRNVVFGASLLFTFALGFGTVLLLVGTFTGVVTALPRSEKVMLTVQKIFTVIMILLGEYFVFRAGTLMF